MMPDQSQGACQAIEDAAALGLVFGKDHFQGDIREALAIFEEVRRPRASKVQAASARARENISERIGMYYLECTSGLTFMLTYCSFKAFPAISKISTIPWRVLNTS